MKITEVTYQTPKYIEVVKIQRKQLNKIEFLKQWLLLTTSLDEESIKGLHLSEAYTYALSYLATEMNNPEIVEGINAGELINFNKEREPIKIQINGFVFDTSLLTVQMADIAEKRCYIKRDEEVLGFYLLATMCVKGFKHGLNAIIDADFSTKVDEEIKAVLEELKLEGFVTLDLWSSLENISLIINDETIEIDDNFFLPK